MESKSGRTKTRHDLEKAIEAQAPTKRLKREEKILQVSADVICEGIGGKERNLHRFRLQYMN